MIKNVIFDIAQVLVRYEPQLLAGRVVNGKALAEATTQAVIQFADWGKVDTGEFTEEELFRKIAEANPHCAEGIMQFYERWYEVFYRMDGMEELVARLDRAGYQLYYLSNFPGRAFEYVKDNFEVFQYVRQGLVSYEVGLVKPDPAIYKALTDRFHIVPQESVFTDDRRENTKAAAQLGFYNHTFSTPRFLEQYLVDLGLEF
ncbi:MAG: HAD family phosphatase [Angelakisella sp.]|nr:HAD family phosphatase [Angelakisella sp.]